MSYARFGADGSNVYVYLDCSGFLLCVCGDPCETGLGFKAYKTTDMINHLRAHQSKGDFVPDYTFELLISGKEEIDKRIVEIMEDLKAGNNWK